MTTIRRATVTCPHCHKQLVVQDSGGLPKERADRIFAAADEAFRIMDKAFRKIFNPRLWR